MRKPLIVYYSRKGENYWNGQIKNLAKGNTEIVAEMIAGLTGGDLFEVQTVQDYAADYYACTDQAKAELQQNARPPSNACRNIWNSTTPSLSATPTGGAPYQWRCSPCWKGLT